ncbi:MAG TPA: hypothetical protein VF372_05205, partial [Thermodesulfobacteriota bacterium]
IYKVMQTNKVKVLQAVKGKSEIKVKYEALKGKSPKEITKIVGYPGKVPVFADSSKTKPRVYYIMP